jgi:hypothetical protein
MTAPAMSKEERSAREQSIVTTYHHASPEPRVIEWIAVVSGRNRPVLTAHRDPSDHG